MRFLYRGFTHNGSTRSFNFQGIDDHKVESLFAIHVNLPLFASNCVSMQEAPSFCLQLLTNANEFEPTTLTKFHEYSVLQEDFVPVLADRARRAKLKASKAPPRRVFRRPSQASQFTPAGQLGRQEAPQASKQI